MKPNTSRNIDGSGETWTVVDLPDGCSVQDRRILLGVVQTGLVWPQINLLAVAVWLCAEKDVVKSACSAAGHVYVDHSICHFEILQRGATACQGETTPSQVFGNFCLTLKLPAWRIGRNRFCLSRPRGTEAHDAQTQAQHYFY